MSIPWIIVITITIIILQSYIYHKWGLHRIQYKRSFSRPNVFEGEEVEMIDIISNNKLLPVPWLRLESKINASLQFRKQVNGESEIDSDEFHRTLFSLMPYQKIKRRQTVTCNKRGYFRFNTVSMTTGDIFGFGGTFKNANASADILIYPKLLPIEDIPLPSHSWLGDVMVRRWIVDDPFVHAGVREYSYGDPMNTVNWKATARTGSFQVSKKDFTADHHLMIYLNFDESEDIWMPVMDEELFERGISYAASIAEYAISQGISTGFGCNSYLIDRFDKSSLIKESVRIEPENGGHQLSYLFETMAKLKMDRSMSFNQFLREDLNRKMERTDILLITSILTEKMKEHISELELQGNAVEILWLDKEVGVDDAE